MHPYEKLTVWRKAHALALELLRSTEALSAGPHRDLVVQLRRAAVSVATNIVEGSARSTAAQFAESLQGALDSCREAWYLVRLLADLEVLRNTRRAVLEARCEEVCKMLLGLLRHLAPKPKKAGGPSAAQPPGTRASRPVRAALERS